MIGERFASQVVEALRHTGKIHLRGDVDKNIELASSDFGDLLGCPLGNSSEEEGDSVSEKAGYLERRIVDNIALNNVNVAEPFDGGR